MDKSLLSSLGLSEVEVRLYQAVVKVQEITPALLAKAASMKRTTAYSVARSLVEKGFLVEDSTKRPRTFKPAGPEDLSIAVEIEKKRSLERQELLKRLSEQVSITQAEKDYPVPRIRFIEEEKLNDYFHQAFPMWNESMLETGEPVFWGFQDATLVEHYEEQLHYWWSISPPELSVKLLTNLSGAEKRMQGKYERREMKYWGEATNFVSSTWIAGDYVLMVNTRQRPHYAIEIHSRVLAHDQREVFKNLWPLVQ
ncbi:MAG: Transcriptional regulator, TrmB [Parcubacteria bacterium C7867-001]|nr:MAG: Transcriptional regulator, TrmB [Parcubacteria bacterium C7867-001]